MFSIQEYKQQIYNIIGAAMEVHHELGFGLLEPIYQEALQVELNDMNIPNEREQEIPIRYKNHLLEKKYKVDFLVGDIVIELKSVEHLTSDHRAQLEILFVFPQRKTLRNGGKYGKFNCFFERILFLSVIIWHYCCPCCNSSIYWNQAEKE